jgi:hypothetical protein
MPQPGGTALPLAAFGAEQRWNDVVKCNIEC